MPSPPAPPPLPIAARRFLNTHTYTNAWHDASEECPICREPYLSTLEPRVRIIGITGCTHAFGLDCLHQYLSIDPHNAKFCPMCRTPWIALQVSLWAMNLGSGAADSRFAGSIRGRRYAAGLATRHGPTTHTAHVTQFLPRHASGYVRRRLQSLIFERHSMAHTQHNLPSSVANSQSPGGSALPWWISRRRPPVGPLTLTTPVNPDHELGVSIDEASGLHGARSSEDGESVREASPS